MSTFDQVIRTNGRTFALASRLLPPKTREATVILYAWFRRADDAVDEVPAEQQAAAAETVRAEIGQIYSGAQCIDPLTEATRQVVERFAIPRLWLDEFANGMVMDADALRYKTIDELLLYCYRVAGTVGATMAHVLGAPSREAVQCAIDLGIAMQLTNICRDVVEDAGRGRIYLPAEILPAKLALLDASSAISRDELRLPIAQAIALLLDQAEKFYRNGELGLIHLSPRIAFAICAAQRMYREIGVYLRRSLPSGWTRRSVVPAWRKWVLVLDAAMDTWIWRSNRAVSGECPPSKVSP